MRKAQIVAEYLPPPQEEHIAIDLLIPYARNARTHSPEQIAQLAASILEFGWTNSILWDENGIVAGHGRVLAARQLYEAGKTIRHPNGAEIPPGTIPAKRCDGWSDAQRKAYILADNQLALNAGWDFELLKVELGELAASDFNLELVGFDNAFLTSLFPTDEAPPNDFAEKDENIETEHECPKCGYRWSGPSQPSGADQSGDGGGDDEG